MFISKKDLNDLKSKAGAASQLQSQIDKLKSELKELNSQLDFDDCDSQHLVTLFLSGITCNSTVSNVELSSL